MGRNAYRDEYDTDQVEAYWRRRAVTLAAGLGVLGLLAWAFTGGGGKPAPAAPTPGVSQASGLRPAAADSGPPTSPPVVPTASGPTASGPSTPSASADVTPGGHGSTYTPEAQKAPAGTGGRCSPGTLVLSLFTSRPGYHTGQDPEFEVYAVSTAAGRCTLDLGPGKLTVVVMSSGRVIWDSADCARAGASQTAELSRGVPAQESIVWNRAVTLPGCVTLASARPGTYQVRAKTGIASSPVRTFRLVRLTPGVVPLRLTPGVVPLRLTPRLRAPARRTVPAGPPPPR
jgi:hypothetical protein